MNQEVKALWIAALRSGKYTQTTEVLCDGKSFCAVGVLCEVLIDNKIARIEKRVNTLFNGTFTTVFYNGCSTTFPRELNTLIDLPGYETHHIESLNDMGWTFNEIADHIEKQIQ